MDIMVLMRTSVRLRHLRDEQGAVAIMTAFLMVGLILCAAIVVDLGNARDVRRQSQNAADAASLAGANLLYPAGKCKDGLSATPCLDDAVTAVKIYAHLNFQVEPSDWTNNCEASTGSALANVASSGTNCISFDSGSTLVRVYMPTRTIPTFFGGIIKSSSIPVGSSAQAVVRKAVKCSLCVLGDVITNNSDFTVVGGSIAVGGKVEATSGNSKFTANNIGVVETVSNATPVPLTPGFVEIDPFTDPLADPVLKLPLDTSAQSSTLKSNPCTEGPGSYGTADIKSLSKNTDCNLTSGLYVISGLWSLGNNEPLKGTGVTLYVKNGGRLDFSNGDAIFTAPLTAPLAGVPAGYAIIYDRTNANPLTLQGNGKTNITGVIYLPASTLVFNGNSTLGFTHGPVVVAAVSSVGNKSKVVISDPDERTVLPGLLHLNK